jgi:predicted Zn-dependent protease
MKYQWCVLPVILGFLFPTMRLTAQETTSVSVPTSEVQKTKQADGKDDIQAIGRRQIGKRGLGNWYSLENEVQMGREYSKAIEVSAKWIEDPAVVEYVNRIGQNLGRNSDAAVPFTIKVIDSEEINAFALPGGFLYVTSGLVLSTQEEAELAGVMAHEIAHVAAHHASRQMTRSNMFALASLPLIFVGGGLGVALREAAGLAIPLGMTKFSRGFEAEADYLGVEYLYKAGYDPQAFISFFERVQTAEKQNPGLIAKAFSTHPQTADRVKKTQREISRILPAREAYVVSTSEFEEIRSRLVAHENLRQRNQTDPGKPVLRRRTTASD